MKLLPDPTLTALPSVPIVPPDSAVMLHRLGSLHRTLQTCADNQLPPILTPNDCALLAACTVFFRDIGGVGDVAPEPDPETEFPNDLLPVIRETIRWETGPIPVASEDDEWQVLTATDEGGETEIHIIDPRHCIVDPDTIDRWAILHGPHGVTPQHFVEADITTIHGKN